LFSIPTVFVAAAPGEEAHVTDPAEAAAPWPALPLEAWSDTYATLHRWMQIVGKVRLVQSPWVNHAWHATLYPTSRG
jgi:hypothetical protein